MINNVLIADTNAFISTIKRANTPVTNQVGAGLSLHNIMVMLEADTQLFGPTILKIKQLVEPIIKNKKVYRFYNRSSCTKYDTIDSAIADYNNASNKILVYFADIDRYGLCVCQEYQIISSQIADVWDGNYDYDYDYDYDYGCTSGNGWNVITNTPANALVNSHSVPFNPRQIILSTCRQKIILFCASERIPVLENLIHAFYGKDIKVHTILENKIEAEVMIDRLENDHAAVAISFDKLRNFIYGFDKKLADIIRLPKVHICANGTRYICKNIKIAKQDIMIEEVVEIIATDILAKDYW